MSGFKSGASDPYADDGDESDADETTTTEPERSDDSPTAEPDSDMTETTTTQTSTTKPKELPFIVRRRMNNESTQWQRSRLTFFVRDDVKRGERELKSDVEGLLNEEVSKFDLREAAYLVAQEHPDAVAEKLEELGVGFEL